METERLPFRWLWALLLSAAALTPVLPSNDYKEAAIQVGFHLLLFLYALRLAEKRLVFWSAPDTLLALFVAVGALSRFWASVPAVADDHLLRFLPAWGVFFLLRQSAPQGAEGSLWRLLAPLSGLAAAYAVLQRMHAEFIPSYVAWKSQDRSFSTFGYPDMWAAFLLILWPFLFLTDKWEGAPNGRDWKIVCACLFLAAFLFSGSSPGMAGLALQLLLAAYGNHRGWMRAPSWLGPGTFRAALAASAVALLSCGAAHYPVKDRVEVWKAAAQMAWDAPLAGRGVNHYPVHFDAYRPVSLKERLSKEPDFARRVHSEPLETAVELGLLGLALAAWFWGALLKASAEKPQEAPDAPWVGALSLAGAFGICLCSEALRQPGTLFFAFLAAGWWALRSKPAAPHALGSAPSYVLAALLASGAAYGAVRNARMAYAAAFSGEPTSFLEHLPADLPARAAELEALVSSKAGKDDRWKFMHELGNVYSKMGRLKGAESQYRAAIALNPKSAPTFINLGNVFVLEAKDDGQYLVSAVYCYREALRLDPEAVEAHFNLAYALYLQKDMPEAVKELDEVLRRQGDHARALQLKKIIVP